MQQSQRCLPMQPTHVKIQQNIQWAILKYPCESVIMPQALKLHHHIFGQTIPKILLVEVVIHLHHIGVG